MTSAEMTQEAKRKRNQELKQKLRTDILQTMPKGGVVVEIGVWRGEFSRILLDQLQPDRLILVDPWKNFEQREGAFDGHTQDEHFEEIYQNVMSRYAAEIASGKVEIRRGLSSDILAEIPHESLSFVYLDGDHSYDGVSADLQALWPLMLPGGIIMMDDYHRRGWWGNGVILATNEFIGAHASELRIHAVRGAQLAIQKNPANA